MNVELKLEKNNTREVINLKEANKSKSDGDAELSTSCLFCKFKPNCVDAIPYYNQAATLYRAAGQWAEEIYCREKLVFCFRDL